MARYPLLFTLRDTVYGDGFVAEIVAHGSALMVEEEDGAWVYGVNPGGLASGGPDKAEAYQDFRQDYTAVLYDLAEDAKNFKAFKRLVEEFFEETNLPTEAEWQEAVQEVRAGKVDAPLPRRSADSELTVEVRRQRRPRASDNVLEERRPAVAA